MKNGIRIVSHHLRNKIIGVPLWVIGACGLVGVLIDLDHPIAYWITGEPSRFAHFPLAIVSGVVLCFVGACLGRLYVKKVLGAEKT